MNNKPTIYKEEWNKKDNNKKYCYLTNRVKIEEVIQSIFESIGPVYDKKVYIETTQEKMKTYLYSRDNNKVTTIDQKEILIDDIMTIKRIS